MRTRGSILLAVSALVGAWFLVTGCGQVIGLEDSYSEVGSAGAGGTCSNQGKSCTANSQCCGFPDARCVDFLDNNNQSIGKQCTPTCQSDSECGTGCCAPLDPSGQSTTLKVCALPNYCDDIGKECVSSSECHSGCCDSSKLKCAAQANCSGM